MGALGVGILYSHRRAVVRMASSASRNDFETFWSVLTMYAFGVPPACAMVPRLAAALDSLDANTPMTKVRIGGISSLARFAIAATPAMSFGSHDVGRPS